MPKAVTKRRRGSQTVHAEKRAKPDRPPGMTPLCERRNESWMHTTKKDGSCRVDCRECKDRAFEEDALHDPDHSFHSLYVCREKGRDGSPTYDHAGYELDYDKVSQWFKPTSVRSLKPTLKKTEKFQERMGKEASEREQMAGIFYEDGAAPHTDEIHYPMESAWKAKVEEDIGVPWHKIGLEDFKEWERHGFARAKKGEYTEFSQEEKDRLSTKLQGSVYRK